MSFGHINLHSFTFAFQIHDVPFESHFRELMRQILIGSLQMLLVISNFLMTIFDFRIKLPVGATIQMVNNDDFPKIVEILANAHVIHESIAPMRERLLCEAQTRPCEDELIVVIIVASRVHESNYVVNQAEIHTGDQITFR